MIQELQACYDTIYQSAPGTSNLTVTVQPSSITPNTVEAELQLVIGEALVNNTESIEGDLLMVMKNTLKDIDFEIDNNGDLIVHGEDANNYSLDGEGNLIYTYR